MIVLDRNAVDPDEALMGVVIERRVRLCPQNMVDAERQARIAFNVALAAALEAMASPLSANR